MRDIGHSVYCITNTVNGKRYIGITKELRKRWQRHIWAARTRRHTCKHFEQAWHKYGEAAWEFNEWMSGLTREEACQVEQWCIAILGTHHPDYGYNQTLGGDAAVHSEEVRRRISNTTKAENSPYWGVPKSEQHRENIRKALKGKPHSEDRKRKMSEAQQRRRERNRLGLPQQSKGERHREWKVEIRGF